MTFENSPSISATVWPTILAAGEPITVALNGTNKPYQVWMFDASGRKVMQKEMISTGPVQLPSDQLAFGTYLIKIVSDGWQKTIKVVVFK